jgi:hypothetical protein
MKKIQKITRLLLLIVVIGALVLAFILIDWKSSELDRDDATAVVFAFAAALRNNDVEGAKLLSDSGQWHRIENWMLEGEPFECIFSWSFSLDPDNNEAFLVCSPALSSSAKETNCGYGYKTICTNGRYRFSITELQLIQTDQGWQVINWSKISESIDGEKIRYEPD